MRFLILALWAAAAVAHGADNSTSRILTCAKLSADAERLSCYDDIAKGLRSQQSASPAPAAAAGALGTRAASGAAASGPASGSAAAGAAAPSATPPGSAPAASAAATQAREFGLPLVKPAAVDEVKSVKAAVTATHHSPNGNLVIELDNGQSWRQVGTVDMGLEVGDSVTISRALLGSFWLAPPSGRGSKVSRLR